MTKGTAMRTCATIFLGVLATAPAICAAQAEGGEPAERDSGQLAEIVVTAQRREESLQNVPISISAFTASDLEKSNITQARDYLMMSPNVSFSDDGQTGNRSIRISIRGVSNVSLGEIASPNALGYYIDEFNVGSVASNTINPGLLDVERVEVLRGPQGTYFGRNSTGGAINITTKLPDRHWFAELGGKVGNFGTWGGHGIVNVPLSDTFFLRGVLNYESSTGLVKNIIPTGTPNSGYDQTDARLSARWLITDNFTADFSYSYSNDTEGFDGDVNTGVLDLDTMSIEGPTFRPISDGLPYYPQNQRLVAHGTPEWNRNGLQLANLRLTYDFGGFTLKSITGQIRTRNSRMFDQDVVSPDTINRRNEWHADSTSQEFRLQSKSGNALDWVVGALYARDKNERYNRIYLGTEFTYTYPDTGETVGLAPPFPDLAINENNSSFTNKSAALYGEVTWHFTDAWAFTAGGRYTHDKIDNTLTGLIAFGSPQPDLAGSSSFNDFSPRAVLTYKLSPDVNFYASIARGYKAGGNNLNGSLPQHVRPFAPEKAWNYEVGFKSEFWDHRALLNGSVFYMKWSDLQSDVIYLIDPTDISSAVSLTESAANATSKGIDLEARFRPIEPLTLGFTLGYLDATFGKFPNAVVYSNEVDLSGRQLPQSPRWTGNASAEWSKEVSDSFSWYARFEESFRSKSFSNLQAVAAAPLGLPQFPYQSPSFAVSNLSAGVNVGDLTIRGSIDNLFDKQYYTGTGDHFGFAGVRVRPHPRMWLIEAIYRMR
ncbi:MAG: TonB-dependent receptor [Proteobacteria bacterium]|nr:TonB-dependent receptor [Pseudomonadota bacterium]